MTETTAQVSEFYKEQVRGAFANVFNAKDLAAVERYYHQDVVVYHPVRTARGRDDFAELVATAFTAFPDWHLEEEDSIAEGNRVAAYFEGTGTNTGVFVGFPPTGGTFRTAELSIVHFEGDKAKEIWVMTDLMGQMQQVGQIPEGPPPKPMLMLLSLMQRLSRKKGERAAPERIVHPEAQPEQLARVEGPKALVRDFGEVVLNGQDWSAADRFLSADLVVRHPTQRDPMRGVQAFKALVDTARAGFPDWRLEIDELLAEGDLVAARLTSSGTHTGTFVGFPPTGRRFAVTEAMVFRLDGDRIREIRIIPNLIGQMRQLGLMGEGPPPKPVIWLMQRAQRRGRSEGVKGGQMIQMWARFAGIVFLGAGVLGFIPGITRDYGEMSFAGPDSGAELLGLFNVSVLQNVLHLATGAAAIAAARTWGGARKFLLPGALAYLGLAVYGFVTADDGDANFLPTDLPDDIFHLALGLFMLMGWGMNKDDHDKVSVD